MWGGLVSQVAPSTDGLTPWLNSLVSLGGFGLLIILLLIGKLWPKSNVDELIKEKDAWKASCKVLEAALADAQSTIKQQTEQGEVANRLLTEIKANTRNRAR